MTDKTRVVPRFVGSSVLGHMVPIVPSVRDTEGTGGTGRCLVSTNGSYSIVMLGF